MHGLTGGDWKRDRYLRKPRQSPTLPIRVLTCGKATWLLGPARARPLRDHVFVRTTSPGPPRIRAWGPDSAAAQPRGVGQACGDGRGSPVRGGSPEEAAGPVTRAAW